MTELVRFGVSLEKELLDKFDRLIRERNYHNRSEALRDVIRENLVKKEWVKGKEVAGTITLIYNHHKRELVNKLTEIQHNFHTFIVSGQHIHLDHDNCLETIVVKGKPNVIEKLANNLKSTKGVMYGALTMASTGKRLS